MKQQPHNIERATKKVVLPNIENRDEWQKQICQYLTEKWGINREGN